MTKVESPRRIQIDSISPKLLRRDNSKIDFANLSPKYIVEKFEEAELMNRRIRFKGIGIESTLYYNKYMQNKKNKKNTDKIHRLPEEYVRRVKFKKRTNERLESFNRIRDRLITMSEKKPMNLSMMLSMNLNNAFAKLDRASAYAKYNADFP